MVQPNPFYTDPAVGQLATNLGLLIFGDRSRDAQNQYYRARSANYEQQAVALARRNQAMAGMQDLLTSTLQTRDPTSGAMRPATQEEAWQRFPALIAGMAQAQGDLSQIPNIFAIPAAHGLMLGDERMARLRAVAGGSIPSATAAATPGYADVIRTQEDRAAAQRTGITAGASLTAARERLAQEREMPTLAQAQGRAFAGLPPETQQQILRPPVIVGPDQTAISQVTQQPIFTGPPRTPTPRNITPAEVAATASQVYGRFTGRPASAADAEQEWNRLFGSLEPAEQAEYTRRVAAALQRADNPAVAAEAGIQYLREIGATYRGGGIFSDSSIVRTTPPVRTETPDGSAATIFGSPAQAAPAAAPPAASSVSPQMRQQATRDFEARMRGARTPQARDELRRRYRPLFQRYGIPEPASMRGERPDA